MVHTCIYHIFRTQEQGISTSWESRRELWDATGQWTLPKFKHHLWSASGFKCAVNSAISRMKRHVRRRLIPFNRLTCTHIQKSNLSVVTTKHLALISQFSTLTLDQMSSFVMTLRNITNGADKQRKYKVLWCAKCSRPMFSKTMCPMKWIKKCQSGNEGQQEMYGGRRSSAQVGFLAKAFHDCDQFLTGTLEHLNSMWGNYKSGSVYRQHRWLGSLNSERKEEKHTIDFMV